MKPLLKAGRELVKIIPITGPLKKKDIVLFRYNGRYVLHRIIKTHGNLYDICGDNCFQAEKNIPRDDIFGILFGIIKDGKEKPLSGIKNRLYTFFWCDLFLLRCTVLRVRAFLSKLKHLKS